MCGIAGVLSPQPLLEDAVETVMRMNGRLSHRGPDSEGLFRTNNAIFAMRRLAIVDLEGGKQPLFNETRDIAIVCNGEIYNHRELRDELKSLGHVFATGSDVETIIHAYEEYGAACLGKLRGMFAFALWDGRGKGKVLLARDRMGEKPLFLRHDSQGRLWFSSELQSLAGEMEGPKRMTPGVFNSFMAFQYVPEPLTPLEGVEVLQAGHCLETTCDKLDAASRSYWDIASLSHDPAHAVETVRDQLSEACRLMGTADVPVAVALSGGIDSSLVAALTARHYPGQIRAFSVGYKGRPETDERHFAQALARHLGIEFTDVEVSTDQVVAEFPELVAAMDVPVGDIAAYGYYAVARAARRAKYPVLLSGIGGDEFFWGYQWVREAVLRNEKLSQGDGKGLLWRWQRMTGRDKPRFFEVHAELCQGDAWSRALMPENVAASLPEGAWHRREALDSALPAHLAATQLLNRTWLRSNCLALSDRMSMAHAVELRLPLLDIGLIESVTGMRNAGLADWRQPHKWLLIEALADVLPADVLSRRKQGFTPPVQGWTTSIVDRFLPFVRDGALVRQGLVRSGADLAGLGNNFLYKLVLLECWARRHIYGESA